MTTGQKSVLLIISGGIAAYKTADLVRQLHKNNIGVTCILTKAGSQFITPLTLATLSQNEVFTDLFDLKEETEIGHIQLSRQADLVVVVPATANIIAKMSHGITDDLATTCLLATDKAVLIAPAMNVKMWENEATQHNIQQLKKRGFHFCGPAQGEMACGETGLGRMSEVDDLCAEILRQLDKSSKTAVKQPLSGKSVLITAGPTHEKIDPVRYIANHSSGKQGYALAQAALDLGADVTLISGPVHLDAPSGARLIKVTSALEMFEAVKSALPADIAIFAAAVADWHVSNPANEKIKKTNTDSQPTLTFRQNPDILQYVSELQQDRPKLVIGFAAETENVIENAQAKLKKKGCDIIIANDVAEGTDTFGGNNNQIHFITKDQTESWKNMSKKEVSKKIYLKIQ